MGGKSFYEYFITLCYSELCMAMAGAKRFISSYDISAIALPKFVALSNIPSCSLQYLKGNDLHFSAHKVWKKSYMVFVLNLEE